MMENQLIRFVLIGEEFAYLCVSGNAKRQNSKHEINLHGHSI